MRSPANSCRRPAAIWDRPALCTQTKSTAGLSVMSCSWSCRRRRIALEEPATGPERDVDQCDQDRDFDQGPNDTGERLPRRDAIRADRHRNGQFEIISGRRERERRRLRIAQTQSVADGHPEREGDEKIGEQWERNKNHVQRLTRDGFPLQCEEQHDREEQAVESPGTDLRQEATLIPVAALSPLAC